MNDNMAQCHDSPDEIEAGIRRFHCGLAASPSMWELCAAWIKAAHVKHHRLCKDFSHAVQYDVWAFEMKTSYEDHAVLISCPNGQLLMQQEMEEVK